MVGVLVGVLVPAKISIAIRVLTHDLDYNPEDLNWWPRPNKRMANRKLGPALSCHK